MSDDRSPTETKRESRAAAAELYRRYSEELLGFFRSTLPLSKIDATDLLNHIFVELIQWYDNNPGKTIENPRGFLYTLAKRHLGKHVDRLRRTPCAPTNATAIDDLEPSPDAVEYDLEYLAGVGEGRRGLLRAMRRLGNPEDTAHSVSELQLAIYFRFWVGMTEGQVSEVLGMSRQAVARRLRRAKKELKVQLEQLEQAEPGSTITSTTLLERWWKEIEAEGSEAVSESSGAIGIEGAETDSDD